MSYLNKHQKQLKKEYKRNHSITLTCHKHSHISPKSCLLQQLSEHFQHSSQERFYFRNSLLQIFKYILLNNQHNECKIYYGGHENVPFFNFRGWNLSKKFEEKYSLDAFHPIPLCIQDFQGIEDLRLIYQEYMPRPDAISSMMFCSTITTQVTPTPYRLCREVSQEAVNWPNY